MKLSEIKTSLIKKQAMLPKEHQRIQSYQPIKSQEVKESSSSKPMEVTSYQRKAYLGEIPSQAERLTTSQQLGSEEGIIDKIKIIGITGSRGKTTTACIVHEYLKALGYKSILYSSAMVDSPVSLIKPKEAVNSPLRNEGMLLNLIEEAELYGAEYIVLEVNETTIKKGLVKDIPFTLRALTNIIPNHNQDFYSSEEYLNLKKAFFTDIEEECKCVIGLSEDISRESFNQLLRLNNQEKITFSSKYICERKNADYTNVDCLLYDANHNLEGLTMKIRVKEQTHTIKTKVILPHQMLNFTCAVAIIEALNIFNIERFNECIKNITIPGREEIIKVNNRYIVIGMYLAPALEVFKGYQREGLINSIKVVTGAIGTGYKGWDSEYLTEKYISRRSEARRFAISYAKQYSDYCYFTSDDPGAEDPAQIAKELQSYLNNEIPSTIIVDREEAIRQAIKESKEKELIYLGGRGNKRILCDSATTMKLIKDIEVVEQVIKEMGWEK